MHARKTALFAQDSTNLCEFELIRLSLYSSNIRVFIIFQIYGQLKIRMQQKLNQLANSSAVAANNNAPTPTGGGGVRNGSVVGKNHVTNGHNSNPILERLENDILRMRRTTNLLILVGVIFCVGWLPLNIFNTVCFSFSISVMYPTVHRGPLRISDSTTRYQTHDSLITFNYGLGFRSPNP